MTCNDADAKQQDIEARTILMVCVVCVCVCVCAAFCMQLRSLRPRLFACQAWVGALLSEVQ